MTLKVVSRVRSDADLVEGCLRGHQDSWSELIRRYKQLVHSIIRQYDVAPEDALDIFQAVWLEFYTALPHLRHVRAMPKWIITVTSHQCLRWKQQRRRDSAPAAEESLKAEIAPHAARMEQQQIVRRALDQLSQRCQEMIRLLFFRQPPLSYMQAAARLGLAVGSIGFIRGRCLKRMRSELERLGF